MIRGIRKEDVEEKFYFLLSLTDLSTCSSFSGMEKPLVVFIQILPSTELFSPTLIKLPLEPGKTDASLCILIHNKVLPMPVCAECGETYERRLSECPECGSEETKSDSGRKESCPHCGHSTTKEGGICDHCSRSL